MKIQIRKNVFETNSSTQHTVTVCNKGTDYKDYIGKAIVLGKDVNEDIFWDKKHNPKTKFHLLWCSLIGYDSSIGDFIKGINFIRETFEPLGIIIDITTDPKDYDIFKYSEVPNELSAVMGWLFESKEDMINFVFNYDSWYDAYEDNYGECPYEKEIKTGNKTVWHRDG